MANAFDQFWLLLQEFISPAVINLVFKDDDIAWNLIDTFQPETTGGRRNVEATGSDTFNFPTGYEAQFRIKVQAGGRVAGGTFGGSTFQMLGKDSHLAAGRAADKKYLDPRKTPAASYINILMKLRRLRGSVTVDQEQIWADMQSNPIEEVASDFVADATKKFRSVILNSFYTGASSSLGGALATATDAETVVETAGGVKVDLTDGPFGRFLVHKGDRIVAGTDASPSVGRAGSVNTPGEMLVVNVDADERAIWLQSLPGEGSISITAGDRLYLLGTYVFDGTGTDATNALMTEGIESLLTNSGTFPGSTSPKFPSGLDVDHHSELKAFITDTSATPEDPTMESMTILLDKILDIEKEPPTAMIAERSLWTLFSQLERDNNALIQVPMGQTFAAAGGVTGPMLSHMEHRFQKFSSVRVREGTVVGLNPATWRKYIPMGDRTIRWVLGSGVFSGAPSIFGPLHDGVQLLETLDAPFDGFVEFGCLDPRANLRRIGLRTQRDV